MPLNKHPVYCVAITFKMTEQVEQWICIKFCVKLEHSSTEIIWMTQKAVAMGKPGDWQLHQNNVPTHASHLMQSFSEKHKIIQVTQSPYNPDFVPCDFWLSSKLKSPLKGKRFQITDETQENTIGQLIVIRTVWGLKVPTLKGTEVSLSCVQCFLYLVSSSKNVSSFHSTWLDTFWTDSYFSSLRRIKWGRYHYTPLMDPNTDVREDELSA